MIGRKELEIMAPVGSYESLMGAVQGGADSVYFGVERLNMRSKSSANFTLDDLSRIVAICREHELKTYLTVNTILYDEDIQLMRSIIDKAKEEGVSAIIASDQAAIFYARSVGMEVHISTQLNVSNTETLRFYAQYADVVVLARELSLKQVKNIHENIIKDNICGPRGELVKIEMFSHGALCMAVSGKCYLSLHDSQNSANRGSCRQICRRSYLVTDKETGAELEIDNEFIMSPKDLCTIDFLDCMIDSGVRVFKIEGRARSGEYVKRVCECYNEALNSVLDGTYTEDKIANWKERLSEVFNRGFWDGYYLGRKLGEWSSAYGSSATKRKVYIGKVTNYFTNIEVAEILIEAAVLDRGDECLIFGETSGVVELTAEEIRVGLVETNRAEKGARCSLKTPMRVRRGDKLYKLITVDE
ncbi:MAG: U32 family peptidase [Rikenellaceae bacterium]|nr:U32 family peptidase [Rikenellaceae bacterium]